MSPSSDVGGYRLDAVIGRGASSTVWRASRRGAVHQVVAVKRLAGAAASTPEEASRLRAEAEVLAALDHPHIVRILDVVEEADGLAVVMALAPGGSLADVVDLRGPLDAGQLVAVAAPVAAALGSAHRRGLVHGDVKPANVLLSSDGEPMLADFGMASLEGNRAAGGTDGFLAPELRSGVDAASPAGDVWSLGATCVALLTGLPPEEGALDVDASGLLSAARPDLPHELVAVVASMLAADPSRRPADGDALAAALRAAVPPDQLRRPEPVDAAALPGGAARPPTRAFGATPPRDDPVRRFPWQSAAVLAVVVAGLGAVAYTAISRGGDDCPVLDAASLARGGAQVRIGDVTGEGCEGAVAFGLDPVLDEMVLEVWTAHGDLQQRFVVGRPGDQVLLGDFDCDGVATVALYRPSDGTVVVYDRWPNGDSGLEPSARLEREPSGTASIAVGDDGCDVVVVEPGVDA